VNAKTLVIAALLGLLSLPASAGSCEPIGAHDPDGARDGAAPLARFAPRTSDPEHRIDYSVWGDALGSMVVGLGPSLRKAAPRPYGFTNTRLIRGHNSRLRLEGSRVIFSLLSDEIIASLSEYRRDLERVGTELDIPSLSRNEQLAFWLNLHNVAVIEQIALAYPVIIPSAITIEGRPLHDARFLEVAGVKLSLRDIRERIVYPNWSDARVIYGFWHGDIGSPLLQPMEFTGYNLDTLLTQNAVDFVNSLRGAELRGDVMHVSRLYDEAGPFYFPRFEEDLRAHLSRFAKAEVAADLPRAESLKATIWEDDIADLARGQKQVVLGPLISSGRNPVNYSSKTPVNVQQFVNERRNKREILRRRGEPIWTITLTPLELPDEAGAVPEIE
jgi:hypothetical protein